MVIMTAERKAAVTVQYNMRRRSMDCFYDDIDMAIGDGGDIPYST